MKHLALSLCAVVAASQLPAQTRVADSAAARKTPILGVFDAVSGNALEGAEVIDLYVDDVYRTSASGLVGLGAFHSRNDSAAVRIRRIGYADTAFVVMVGARDTAPISVFLNRSTTLDAIVTNASRADDGLTPHLREFTGRMNDKSLTGRFLTPADLAKHSAKPLGDVVHDLMAGKLRECSTSPKFFLDGSRWIPTKEDFAQTADEFEAVEFYTAGAAPLQFGGTVDATAMSTGTMSTAKSSGLVRGDAASGPASGIRAASSCGVVLLWKREHAVP